MAADEPAHFRQNDEIFHSGGMLLQLLWKNSAKIPFFSFLAEENMLHFRQKGKNCHIGGKSEGRSRNFSAKKEKSVILAENQVGGLGSLPPKRKNLEFWRKMIRGMGSSAWLAARGESREAIARKCISKRRVCVVR